MNKYNNIRDLIFWIDGDTAGRHESDVGSLMTEIRQCIEQLVDLRRNRNTQYRFSDVAMTAFLVFFTRSPLFLSRQRQMAQDNDGDSCATSLFGIARILCDYHILQSLDGIEVVSPDGRSMDC